MMNLPRMSVNYATPYFHKIVSNCLTKTINTFKIYSYVLLLLDKTLDSLDKTPGGLLQTLIMRAFTKVSNCLIENVYLIRLGCSNLEDIRQIDRKNRPPYIESSLIAKV